MEVVYLLSRILIWQFASGMKVLYTRSKFLEVLTENTSTIQSKTSVPGITDRETPVTAFFDRGFSLRNVAMHWLELKLYNPEVLVRIQARKKAVLTLRVP
jgi:hypothetical protein